VKIAALSPPCPLAGQAYRRILAPDDHSLNAGAQRPPCFLLSAALQFLR
jgi:hypothetical protein